MNFMTVLEVLFVDPPLYGAARLPANVPPSPVLLLFPDLARAVTRAGPKDAMWLVKYIKPYVESVRMRAPRPLLLYHLLPLLPWAILKAPIARWAGSPVRYVTRRSATLGLAASSLRQPSSGSPATCAEELLEAGAGAAAARCAWPAPRAAALVRVLLAWAARAVAMIILRMIIISFVIPRAPLCSPTRSAVAATASARAALRMSTARRTVACVFPPRRTAVMMVMIMSGLGPRPLATPTPMVGWRARWGPTSVFSTARCA